MLNQRYDTPGEALRHRRRGDPVAQAGRHQALRRARRRVRVPQPGRPLARRGAARARLRALPAGEGAGPRPRDDVGCSRPARCSAAALAGDVPPPLGRRPRRSRLARRRRREWTALVAAAKKEGKVVVNTFPGDGYGRALKPFTQAYPDIKLEHTSLHSQDFAPAHPPGAPGDLFTWDVAPSPPAPRSRCCGRPACGIRVRPAIVLPEAKDDAAWEGGFERGFSLVKDRALSYGFVANRGRRRHHQHRPRQGGPAQELQRPARPALEGQAAAARRARDGRHLLADDARAPRTWATTSSSSSSWTRSRC